MKRLLFILPVILLVIACSKNKNGNTPQPVNKTGTVNIEGTDYGTIQIGSQTWMSVNYNGPGGLNYNNGANVPANGKLYTLNEALAVTLPTDWHMPTSADFETLILHLGGTGQGGAYSVSGAACYSLMATTGWVSGLGTDTNGFNALPVGAYFDSTFIQQGYDAAFMTADPGTSSSGAIPQFLDIASASGTASASMSVLDGIPLSSMRTTLRFVKNN